MAALDVTKIKSPLPVALRCHARQPYRHDTYSKLILPSGIFLLAGPILEPERPLEKSLKLENHLWYVVYQITGQSDGRRRWRLDAGKQSRYAKGGPLEQARK